MPRPAETATTRLDRALVDRGIAETRTRAARLVVAGRVRVDGRLATRPAEPVRVGAVLGLDPAAGPDETVWVSRGALKLLHALDHFGLAPAGVALDIGASTGGFTDVLLARGAAHVHAVDVGHGQLAPRIATDCRVTAYEGVNARDLTPAIIPPVDWIVADLSFVSLMKALGPALALARPGAILVALVKPQFEVGRAGVGKGGIVRDVRLHAEAVARVAAWLGEAGWPALGTCESPIAGGDGNVEYLVAARRGDGP